jgi:hypothetical protein
MFAALDVTSGQLFYRFRDRKRWPEFLEFCKQLRTRFPAERLFIVCDNFAPHGKAEVTSWRRPPHLDRRRARRGARHHARSLTRPAPIAGRSPRAPGLQPGSANG